MNKKELTEQNEFLIKENKELREEKFKNLLEETLNNNGIPFSITKNVGIG